jgi:hypothetical protein
MPADVRFGSKADICSAKRHVRSTPESRHVQCIRRCPLCANSGHRQSHSITSSAREKMLNIPEEAHFNNMSTFATDEHLRQDDDLDIPV